jgi:transcriptional regulator with XRE-family HTH domain
MAKRSATHSKDVFLVRVGLRIKATRLEISMSQESLAWDSGLDRSYVGGIERGEHNFSLINLKKIATALRVTPAFLLQD